MAQSPITTKFIDALSELEQASNLGPMAALYAPDARLQNFADLLTGSDAPTQFWQRYRAQFQTISSAFSRIIETPDASVLIWRSEGQLKDGHPITYRGVSILTLKGEQIQAFETYYDSAAFVSLTANAN